MRLALLQLVRRQKHPKVADAVTVRPIYQQALHLTPRLIPERVAHPTHGVGIGIARRDPVVSRPLRAGSQFFAPSYPPPATRWTADPNKPINQPLRTAAPPSWHLSGAARTSPCWSLPSGPSISVSASPAVLTGLLTCHSRRTRVSPNPPAHNPGQADHGS